MAVASSQAHSQEARSHSRSRAFAWVLALPMPVWQILFFIAALLFLVIMSFWSVRNFRVTPDFTFDNWIKIYSAGYFRDIYLRTLLYAVLAAVLSSLIAFPCAYGLAFKASPLMRRLVVASLIMPYFTSYLVRANSWKILLTDRGVINSVLGGIGIGPLPMTSNLFAVMIGYLTLILPIVILLQYFSLANVDRRLIEAAHNLRCGRMGTVFHIIIPSARTGLVLAATFAFILSFGDFVSPSFLGNNKPPTLSVLMVDAVKSGSQWPRAAVVALSMVATLLVVAFLAMNFAYGGKAAAPMKFDRLITLTLKAYIWLALLIVFAPILTSFVFSFDANKFAAIPWGGFSTQWYAEVYADPDVVRGFRNTVIVAVASSILATLIGFTAAYTDYRYDFLGKKLYLALALIPPTIPVIILGLAMLVFQARTHLSGGLHSVVIAHVVYSIPFAMALIRLRLSQMDKDLEAAAWNLGAGQWRALREIIIPFTRPAIFSALFLTMAVSFDEYAMAWFVSGFNETLPVRILMLLQREVSPKVNAIGSLVFIISMTLVMLAQIVFLMRAPGSHKTKRSQVA